MTWRPWREAMAEALYGEGGFYRRSGAPARHFRTAAHACPQWAQAIAALARRVDSELGSPAGMSVIDLGAGGGELLDGLGRLLPERIGLVGVDLAPRPRALAGRIGWRPDLPEHVVGLLVSAEWLDVVPVDVAEVDQSGRARQVEVDETGRERLGGGLPDADAQWLARWWPLGDEPGRRAEIGAPRDHAWAQAAGVVRAGLAVAIDYAAVPDRDRGGTLTGYRSGRAVRPVPDGSTDVTAHVLFESLAEPGDVILTQRAALRRLGVDGSRPDYDGAPADYLRRLAHASRAAELLDPGGLGGFGWLLHPAGIGVPL